MAATSRVCGNRQGVFHIAVEKCPLCFAELLKLSHTEMFLCMNRLFKVMPQHLNWVQVWTLTRPLQKPSFCFFLTIIAGLADVFWIIVLLQNPLVSEPEVTNWWLAILFQDFLLDGKIHCSISHKQVVQSSLRPSYYHHHAWHDVLFKKYCGSFTIDFLQGGEIHFHIATNQL